MKERLVGAAILVALVVLLVPAVLTGPARVDAEAPVSEDIVQSHVIDLTDRSRTPSVDTPRPQSAPAAATAEPSARATPPELPPTLAVAPPRDAPAAPLTGPSSPASQPAVAPPAADRPTGELASAPAASPPATTSTPRPATESLAVQGWVVQLGSFSARANAEKLVAELRGKGYPAFVSQFQGASKVLHRVRVGPEQDRARADALAQRLKRDGFPGAVTPHP